MLYVFCQQFKKKKQKTFWKFTQYAVHFHFSDHDDSIVHGILTENNLFDGSIITPTENYYIEPASRYSDELTSNGIHTIVYKTSDVHMLPHQMQMHTSFTEPTRHYCASQRLHEKMMNRKRQRTDESLNVGLSDKNAINENDEYLSRNKRWLADEVICVFRLNIFFFFKFSKLYRFHFHSTEKLKPNFVRTIFFFFR